MKSRHDQTKQSRKNNYNNKPNRIQKKQRQTKQTNQSKQNTHQTANNKGKSKQSIKLIRKQKTMDFIAAPTSPAPTLVVPTSLCAITDCMSTKNGDKAMAKMLHQNKNPCRAPETIKKPKENCLGQSKTSC